MRKVGVEERRARLAVRHHLAADCRCADVTQIARDMIGLHGTDSASVFLAATARMRAPKIDSIERALYEARTLVRILGMRRTMFVVPVELAPVIQASCTRSLVPGERRKFVEMIELAGIASNADDWLREVQEAAMTALSELGEASASELSRLVPGLREQMRYGEGKQWEGVQGVGPRALFLLAAEGRIVRGRPRGSWISTQYRWAPMESWLGAELAQLETEPARAELIRLWLSTFGPAPIADVKWWTGWSLGEVRRALSDVRPVEVDLGGVTGLALKDDLEPTTSPEPWVALLPALDPTVMGWSLREWFLGDHGPALFDRSGNAGPTVWSNGRVVGGWAQRPDGQIVFRLFEDIGVEACRSLEDAAAQLAELLGTTRILPKFRTPLERELSA